MSHQLEEHLTVITITSQTHFQPQDTRCFSISQDQCLGTNNGALGRQRLQVFSQTQIPTLLFLKSECALAGTVL